MSTPHKDPRAVIEQLVTALENAIKCLNSPANDDLRIVLRDGYAALTAGREALKLRTCTWTQHDDVHMPGTYETECGELWSFVEGGPSDNGTKFCHGCGGLVGEPAPSTPLSKFVNSSPSDREAIGNAAVAEADAEMAKMAARTQPGRMPLPASDHRRLPSCP